jgi:hypothetical protein
MISSRDHKEHVMDDAFARQANEAIERMRLREQKKPEPRKTPADFGIPEQYAVAAQLYAMYVMRNPDQISDRPAYLGEIDALDKGAAGWGR